MPRKHKSPQPRASNHIPPASDLSPPFPPLVEDTSRQSRVKTGDFLLQDDLLRLSSPEPAPAEAIATTEEHSGPDLHSQPSILSQLEYPRQPRSRPLDIRDAVTSTEKVSDQYTPPSEGGIQDDGYGSSPAAPSVAEVGSTNNPPAEPGFSRRRLMSNARSPPISPPQHTARLSSFGSSASPMPYQYRHPPSLYGSPPAPHLPQQHFYAAKDIDLRVPGTLRRTKAEEPTFVRWSPSPFAVPCGHVALLGYGTRLAIVAVDSNGAREIGCLTGLPGLVFDATFLTWTAGQDPSSNSRPLLALSIHHVDHTEAGLTHSWSTVEIYSVINTHHIATLLGTTPVPPQQMFFPSPPPYAHSDYRTHFSLQTSGNYLAVSCDSSGEVFVFTMSKESETATFRCLGKWWTGLQPKIRRDSAYAQATGRPSRSVPPVDSSRDRLQAVFGLQGRLLAICPPSTSPASSVFATLDPSVRVASKSGIEAIFPPPQPSANCEVESPDVETFMGKMARTAALEVVKAGKWLSNQGTQAWHKYWSRDQSSDTSAASQEPRYSPRVTPVDSSEPFPPTHADIDESPRDLSRVSIYDLNFLAEQKSNNSGAIMALATFEPPKGCSYLSFSPQGLSLLTASRQGDLYYVWDLLQMQHVRHTVPAQISTRERDSPRVRQVARFERHSDSTVADVVWDQYLPSRFAVLTKNSTIHLYNLPASAMRWPPSRRFKKGRTSSAPATAVENSSSSSAGFFTSAMGLAGKTQPMLMNWRTASPATGGGFAGIGTTSIGLASATGVRGGKAVASGLSKSLSTATNAVRGVHQAGQSRLHFSSGLNPEKFQLVGARTASKSGLFTLSFTGSQFCPVRETQSQQGRIRMNESVFEQNNTTRIAFPSPPQDTGAKETDTELGGHWKPQDRPSREIKSSSHPLSFAEIETNAPYTPFHTDRRVSLSVFSDAMVGQSQAASSNLRDTLLFGDALSTIRLNLNTGRDHSDDEQGTDIYTETNLSRGDADGAEQIVVTTRRRKSNKPNASNLLEMPVGDASGDEDFFEDDLDVLEFASERV